MTAATPLTVQEVDQEIRVYEVHTKFKCEQREGSNNVDSTGSGSRNRDVRGAYKIQV